MLVESCSLFSALESVSCSGTPVIAASVPDVKDLNRRSIDGEENPPGSSSPEEQLPDLAIEGLALRRHGVGLRQGFESEDFVPDGVKPLGRVDGVLRHKPFMSLADVVRREGCDDDLLALHALVVPSLSKK